MFRGGRVSLQTGYMREVPFPDGSFDVVVSILVVHNVYDGAGRKKALEEIARELKTDGRLLVQDFRHTKEFAGTLEEICMLDVRWSGRQVYTLPPARIVTALKKTQRHEVIDAVQGEDRSGLPRRGAG